MSEWRAHPLGDASGDVQPRERAMNVGHSVWRLAKRTGSYFSR